ncbi:MAG: hypothetical protein ACI9FR_000221 [Cryomorphaceae bacterium]|jgi:hypothetical protein
MIGLFEFATVVMTGLLAGALLTEAFILVPYWKKMPPDEFLRLHHTMSPSLFRYYAPLTVAGSALPIITSSLYLNLYGANWSWWFMSGFCAIALLGFYFGFFKNANLAFATGKDPEIAQAILEKWALLHNMRTVIAAVGFVASLAAYGA